MRTFNPRLDSSYFLPCARDSHTVAAGMHNTEVHRIAWRWRSWDWERVNCRCSYDSRLANTRHRRLNVDIDIDIDININLIRLTKDITAEKKKEEIKKFRKEREFAFNIAIFVELFGWGVVPLLARAPWRQV